MKGEKINVKSKSRFKIFLLLNKLYKNFIKHFINKLNSIYFFFFEELKNDFNLYHHNLKVATMAAKAAKIALTTTLRVPGSKYAHAGLGKRKKIKNKNFSLISKQLSYIIEFY